MNTESSKNTSNVLRASKELDLVIAQQVMGHSTVKQKNGVIQESAPKGVRPLAAYSKDMDAAWEVANQLGIALIPVEGGQWFALVGTPGGWKSPASFIEYLQAADFVNAGAAVSDSAPLAICVAALKAAEKRRSESGAAEGGETESRSSNLTH